MIRVIVDSSSGIKESEKELYNVDLMPLKILMKDQEYLDGVNLDEELFWNTILLENEFPKTSLPAMDKIAELVNRYLYLDDEVIIVTISSGISGTYNAVRILYGDHPRVRIVDSLSCAGGLKLIINEINKYRDQKLDFIIEKVNELIPKITILAVPETLDYLYKGGRLSRVGMIVGNLFHVKPIITIENGFVKVKHKVRGLLKAMNIIVEELEKCDENYPIIPSYTYQTTNLLTLKEKTKGKHIKLMTSFDHIGLSIASHWGPNAFGYIFVKNEK